MAGKPSLLANLGAALRNAEASNVPRRRDCRNNSRGHCVTRERVDAHASSNGCDVLSTPPVCEKAGGPHLQVTSFDSRTVVDQSAEARTRTSMLLALANEHSPQLLAASECASAHQPRAMHFAQQSNTAFCQPAPVLPHRQPLVSSQESSFPPDTREKGISATAATSQSWIGAGDESVMGPLLAGPAPCLWSGADPAGDAAAPRSVPTPARMACPVPASELASRMLALELRDAEARARTLERREGALRLQVDELTAACCKAKEEARDAIAAAHSTDAVSKEDASARESSDAKQRAEIEQVRAEMAELTTALDAAVGARVSADARVHALKMELEDASAHSEAQLGAASRARAVLESEVAEARARAEASEAAAATATERERAAMARAADAERLKNASDAKLGRCADAAVERERALRGECSAAEARCAGLEVSLREAEAVKAAQLRQLEAKVERTQEKAKAAEAAVEAARAAASAEAAEMARSAAEERSAYTSRMRALDKTREAVEKDQAVERAASEAALREARALAEAKHAALMASCAREDELRLRCGELESALQQAEAAVALLEADADEAARVLRRQAAGTAATATEAAAATAARDAAQARAGEVERALELKSQEAAAAAREFERTLGRLQADAAAAARRREAEAEERRQLVEALSHAREVSERVTVQRDQLWSACGARGGEQQSDLALQNPLTRLACGAWHSDASEAASIHAHPQSGVIRSDAAVSGTFPLFRLSAAVHAGTNACDNASDAESGARLRAREVERWDQPRRVDSEFLRLQEEGRLLAEELLDCELRAACSRVSRATRHAQLRLACRAFHAWRAAAVVMADPDRQARRAHVEAVAPQLQALAVLQQTEVVMADVPAQMREVCTDWSIQCVQRDELENLCSSLGLSAATLQATVDLLIAEASADLSDQLREAEAVWSARYNAAVRDRAKAESDTRAMLARLQDASAHSEAQLGAASRARAVLESEVAEARARAEASEAAAATATERERAAMARAADAERLKNASDAELGRCADAAVERERALRGECSAAEARFAGLEVSLREAEAEKAAELRRLEAEVERTQAKAKAAEAAVEAAKAAASASAEAAEMAASAAEERSAYTLRVQSLDSSLVEARLATAAEHSALAASVASEESLRKELASVQASLRQAEAAVTSLEAGAHDAGVLRQQVAAAAEQAAATAAARDAAEVRAEELERAVVAATQQVVSVSAESKQLEQRLLAEVDDLKRRLAEEADGRVGAQTRGSEACISLSESLRSLEALDAAHDAARSQMAAMREQAAAAERALRNSLDEAARAQRAAESHARDAQAEVAALQRSMAQLGAEAAEAGERARRDVAAALETARARVSQVKQLWVQLAQQGVELVQAQQSAQQAQTEAEHGRDAAAKGEAEAARAAIEIAALERLSLRLRAQLSQRMVLFVLLRSRGRAHLDRAAQLEKALVAEQSACSEAQKAAISSRERERQLEAQLLEAHATLQQHDEKASKELDLAVRARAQAESDVARFESVAAEERRLRLDSRLSSLEQVEEYGREVSALETELTRHAATNRQLLQHARAAADARLRRLFQGWWPTSLTFALWKWHAAAVALAANGALAVAQRRTDAISQDARMALLQQAHRFQLRLDALSAAAAQSVELECSIDGPFK